MKLKILITLILIWTIECYSNIQGSATYDRYNRLHIGIHVNSHSLYLRPMIDKILTSYENNRIGAKFGYKYTHQVFEYKQFKISAILFSGFGSAKVKQKELRTSDKFDFFENNLEIGLQPEFRLQNFGIIIEPIQWEYFFYANKKDYTVLNNPINELIHLKIGFKFFINLSNK